MKKGMMTTVVVSVIVLLVGLPHQVQAYYTQIVGFAAVSNIYGPMIQDPSSGVAFSDPTSVEHSWFATNTQSWGGVDYVFNSDATGTSSLGSLVGTVNLSTTYSMNTVPISGLAAGGLLQTSWHDTMSILSNTLPVGTPVSIKLTEVFNGLSQAYGMNVPGNTALVFSGFNWGTQVLDVIHQYVDVNSGINTFNLTKSIVISDYVGNQADIAGLFEFEANATTSYPAFLSGASIQVDKNLYYVDILTLGAYLASESGTDYSSPIPIPASAWLLASGLIGLVGFRRRFR